MAFFQYLVFDGENLPLPDSYEVELEDVEADSGGETEAGTTREGCGAAMVLRGSRCRFLLRRSGLRSWQGMRRRIRSVCSILMWRQWN